MPVSAVRDELLNPMPVSASGPAVGAVRVVAPSVPSSAESDGIPLWDSQSDTASSRPRRRPLPYMPLPAATPGPQASLGESPNPAQLQSMLEQLTTLVRHMQMASPSASSATAVQQPEAAP